MSCAYVSRILLGAAALFIIPIQAHAGGYSGGQGQYSAITPRQAHTILSYADIDKESGSIRVVINPYFLEMYFPMAAAMTTSRMATNTTGMNPMRRSSRSTSD